MIIATAIACMRQNRAKRSGLSRIPSKRWSTFMRTMRRNRYAPNRRPGEDEQRGGELHGLPPAGEREHDREQREREAVGEVGDDVRPARRGDGEEAAVRAPQSS